MSNQMFKTCIIDGQEQYSFARSSKNGQAIETISQAFPEGLLSFLNLDMDELEPLFSAMTGQLRSWADTREKEYVKEFLRSLDTLAQQHIYFELFNMEWTSRIEQTQPADILRRQWRKCRVADMPKELRGMQQQIKDLFTHVLDYDRGHGSVTEKAAAYYRQMNGAAFLFRPLFRILNSEITIYWQGSYIRNQSAISSAIISRSASGTNFGCGYAGTAAGIFICPGVTQLCIATVQLMKKATHAGESRQFGHGQRKVKRMRHSVSIGESINGGSLGSRLDESNRMIFMRGAGWQKKRNLNAMPVQYPMKILQNGFAPHKDFKILLLFQLFY